MPAGAQIINTAGGKQVYTIVTTGSAIRSRLISQLFIGLLVVPTLCRELCWLVVLSKATRISVENRLI